MDTIWYTEQGIMIRNGRPVSPIPSISEYDMAKKKGENKMDVSGSMTLMNQTKGYIEEYRYKCKCGNGWKPTKPGSLVEMICMICNGTAEVDYDTAIAYNISTKPKNRVKKEQERKCSLCGKKVEDKKLGYCNKCINFIITEE